MYASKMSGQQYQREARFVQGWCDLYIETLLDLEYVPRTNSLLSAAVQQEERQNLGCHRHL